ncbi:uncharacterized protein LOC131934805 [Physella acuta]|uniref:uncharacterized protein LOC131934805 n=1 Tax=Physella acuta TaxID=109671 RepID=UPI0027DE2492|nr:uncharacterized protein LOC131934805 [Physella acuta]
MFDYNTSTTYINVIKQLAVDFRCHVNSIHTVPNLTISLYKGDLHRLVYKSPVVNDLQYTKLMSPCDSEVYICRTDIDIIAEKRITVHEKSCGHEDSVIITVSVTLPCTFIFLVLIIGRLVTSARRKIKLRITNKKAEDRLAGDIHLTRVETQCNQDNKQGDSINDLPDSYTGS